VAQEPATIDSDPGVRFAQGSGYFHYAAFCKTPKEFSAQMPKPGLPADQIEFGIGWYVRGTVTRAGAASPEVDGRIVISPRHVRFMPASLQLAGQYVDLPRGDVELNHAPGESEATLRGKDVMIKFHFRKICPTCTPGAAAPLGENAVLREQEFLLLGETMSKFESGWRKTYHLSKGGTTVDLASGEPAAAPRPAPPANASSLPHSDVSPPSPAVSFGPPSGAAQNSQSTSALKMSGPAVLGIPKGRPVKIASGAADGLIVKKIPPQYPLEAKLVRLEGTVVVRAVIDRSGEVAEVSAVSGPPLLESAAVEAVKQWQYRPYAVNGQPVDVETTIEVVFALDRSQSVTRAQNARK